jgi:hypothetical protein
VPEPLQNFDNADADARIKQIHKAGDKKRNGHNNFKDAADPTS